MFLKGLLTRMMDCLMRSEMALERDELQKAAKKHGGTPIREAAARSVTSCCGTVRCVSLRPRADEVPALVVDLDDGTRTMNLVWLGRRRIAGIKPGTCLKVWGRVTYRKGLPTIFNPAYEIKPSH